VGGADAIAPLEALLPTLSWGKSLSGIEMLGRIKHPEAEAALLRLLNHPKRNDTRDAIASALAQQCTTDGLLPLRRMALSDDYDDSMYDIKQELVACAMMAAASGVAIDVPELPALREEVIAREVERQRRIEAMKFDLSDDANLDALDDDLSADDFLDQEDRPAPPPAPDRAPRIPIRRDPAIPGRNEPCPCGSGKKYKKCCLNKSA
jgi:HEAT repeat protein